jgi:hypothetical protein
MRIGLVALFTLGLACPLPAQTIDLGQSLSQLVSTAATTHKQRKVRAELSATLTYVSAAGAADQANRSDPRNADVAGVRLGMTTAQAEGALRSSGYSEFVHDDQPSYLGSVMERWQSEYGFKGAWNDRAPHELVWRKGDEEVRVKFLALPDGPQVENITYWAKDGAPISVQEFTRRVLTKFGEPVNDDSDQFRWCTVKAPDCEDINEAEYPLLVVTPRNRMIYLTGNDPGRKEALEKRFASDVERRKPADQVPSF